MKIMVTGSGGREHALAWKLMRSPRVTEVYVAPGNAGTALEPGMYNAGIDVMDIDAQIAFAKEKGIGLTLIGPEAPLVAGAVDAFLAAGLRCFGPGKQAAQLEGSKSFTKDFLKRHQIPTAAYQTFTEPEAALTYVRSRSLPIVIKADGLAAGKGVVVAETFDQVEMTVREMLSGNAFGEAGARIVIEDFLEGEEASFIVIADGNDFLPFASSQDHKRAYDGDAGPNTGGMGAYSPAPVVTEAVHNRIVEQVIEPTIAGMVSDGTPYTGFLYAGLMISPEGEPGVIEFNCRFGDPETQPIMMRLQSDLVSLCEAAIDGRIAEESIVFDGQVALTVVMASGGYPGSFETGDVIDGLSVDAANSPDQSATVGKVFHAGTTLTDAGVVTAGGRVLGVTALGNTVAEAQSRAYGMIDGIKYKNSEYRSDIGYLAVAREQRDGA